jgi:hypothetical protein
MLPLPLTPAKAAALPSPQLRQSSRAALRHACAAARAPRTRAARAQPVSASASDGANVLAKLGRVFKEKAQADIDRIFKAHSLASACACGPASAPHNARMCKPDP